jgi:elongation factor P hydroxylase
MVKWVEHLNGTVLINHGTRLTGGYSEPYYKAPGTTSLAEVQFTRDYERSALHELGHWCVAGKQRRLLNDYDYWYIPDGRSDEQQRLFFAVEVKPQAVEKYFCTALALPFVISVDNLGNHPQTGVNEFNDRVNEQYCRYQVEGFPSRATEIFTCMQQWYSRQTGQGSS